MIQLFIRESDVYKYMIQLFIRESDVYKHDTTVY